MMHEAWVELIETLWNVNKYISQDEANRVAELIETLWNVNAFLVECTEQELRINRNIVECKLFKTGGGKLRKRRINRNIVECK